jgi:hypothetical protein
MSRGLGRHLRALAELILRHGRPMTFEEMRAAVRRDVAAEPDAELRSSFKRSVRRSLHRMVRDGFLSPSVAVVAPTRTAIFSIPLE